MIIASLPTIPERKESLQQVLRRMLYEQTVRVDKLHVWLNGYAEVPSDLATDERVVYHVEPANPGPWVRYRAAHSLGDEDVLITLDDDLVYPTDYVESCMSHFSRRRNALVVTFGGLRWDPCVEAFEYGDNRFHYSYTDGLGKEQRVAVLMGGVSSFRAKAAKVLEAISFAKYEFNDDLFSSSVLQKSNVEIVCLAKMGSWIREENAAHANTALHKNDAANRHGNFRSLVKENAFEPTAGALEEFLLYSKRILVLSELCPPLKGSEELHDRLIKLCEERASVHLLAPVGSSVISLVQRHTDVPYTVHAESVPEQGGRLDWLSPVRHWRNSRVQRDGESRFLRRLDVVMKKLQPTTVEWFGKELPAWWRQRFGNEAVVPLH